MRLAGERVADPKGRPVALSTRGAAVERLLDRVLHRDGLTIKDVQVRIMSFPDMVAALETGAVDAAIVREAFPLGLAEDGDHVPGREDIAVQQAGGRDQGQHALEPMNRSRMGYNQDDMAALAVTRTVYPHITKDPGVRAGRACIDGTRIAVTDIVCLLNEGRPPEEMADAFATPLSLAQIHAALAYYYDNTDEIEASFAESEKWEAEYERERVEHLRRRQSA